jgi:hypothetical protein
VKTLTKILDGSHDSQFTCHWNGHDDYENQRANHELENGCIQCGRSASNLHLERSLGSAVVKGGKVQVSCLYGDLQKHGWKQEGEHGTPKFHA